ncbi:hypothetical protein BDZ94DRAFT_1227248 [Collybia nuda]|uniref:Transmembrane protein n=1 Tax=Collybia nuda TaxID=64659 RepID=A0A9P5XW69_9AGAR|nr:hypothetical protein BDZ94DRAFT_1227248 [Collybia nuda]
MSSIIAQQDSPEPQDKGKGRAPGPTENTPLLNPGSSSYLGDHTTTPETTRRRLRSKLTWVFLVSLIICIVGFIIVALLAFSYAAKVSHTSPDNLAKNALIFRPDRIDALNTTSKGEIWIKVDGRMGIDVGSVMGLRRDPMWLESIPIRVWKAIGRWGVRRMNRVSVTLSAIHIASEHDPSNALASIITYPVSVPLSADTFYDLSWLSSVSLLVLVQPTSDTAAILHFLQDSWRRGSVALRVDVERAAVRGGGLHETSWRNFIRGEVSNVRASMHLPIPPLHGLPSPGHDVPFPSISELITLQSFGVYSDSNNLSLHASATMVDPIPSDFAFTSPHLPFVISLPSSSNASSSLPLPIASVTTAPFTLTHPNITLDIHGTVLPLLSDSPATLSSFLSRYLSGQPNPVLINSPLAPEFTIDTLFPAPNPRPQILQNVTIRDMKIKPGTPFLASGTVFAHVVLPKGIDINLHVSRVLPDVLVFDGEVPRLTFASLPTPPPLPDPLPENAFGHIRPDDWLPAMSIRDEPHEDVGVVYIVSAKIIDVPLEVLPGRQKIFSNFISKVIFGSDGAVAGILGSAAVSVGVQGLPFPGEAGEMELDGLPFKGSVPVRKKSMIVD